MRAVARLALLLLQVASRPDARDMLDSAYARLWRAPLDSADTWFSRAAATARSAEQPALRAEAPLRLAVVRLRRQSPTVALPLLDNAAALVDSDDLSRRALLHCTRAAVLVVRGDPATRVEASSGAKLARLARCGAGSRVFGQARMVPRETWVITSAPRLTSTARSVSRGARACALVAGKPAA